LIEYYLKHTPKGDSQIVLILIDVMHGFKDTDGMIIKMLNQMQKNFMIVFTKCDRANNKELTEAVEVVKELQAKFTTMSYYVHFTCAKTDFGIPELRNHLLFKMGARQLMKESNPLQK
jgi:GTP-binding protein EngB required for normal cell division